jgi:two-component system, NarL family, sensor histidine kinase UhpB
VALAPDDEHARLTERIITAEQDERRRLAIFLHDGPVQHLSGIALMLDAALGALEDGNNEDARTILSAALDRHRSTIRELRDLSFNIEPVVLRDQGFTPAVRALCDQVGLDAAVQMELDVGLGERLGEKVQVGLYQIIRESLTQAIRRGPPTRIAVVLREMAGGGLELLIEDDGSGERRKASLDSLGERAATLNARFSVEQPPGGGTRVHVVLPRYAIGSARQ